jgi:hypothetical protein
MANLHIHTMSYLMADESGAQRLRQTTEQQLAHAVQNLSKSHLGRSRSEEGTVAVHPSYWHLQHKTISPFARVRGRVFIVLSLQFFVLSAVQRKTGAHFWPNTL